MKKTLLLVLCIFPLSLAAQGWMQSDPNFKPSEAAAIKMQTLSNLEPAPNYPSYPTEVVYAHESDMDLKAYIMGAALSPFGGVPKEKKPCVVYIQGGGWGTQFLPIKLPELMAFAQRGYITVSFGHRPVNVAPWPAQIQDVKTLMRFIRGNADKYGIDTNNIFIWGGSSGGHLALMYGLSQDDASLDTADFGKESLTVNAIAVFHPVADLINIGKFTKMDFNGANSMIGRLFGGKKAVDQMIEDVKKASPVHRITKGGSGSEIPYLILHGNADQTIPFEVGVELADKMEECGFNYTFYKVEGADHSSYEWSTTEIADILDRFFKANIKQ